MRANHVKRRLAAGEPSVGTWLGLPSPEAAEYVATVGFDWLVADYRAQPDRHSDSLSDVRCDRADRGHADGPHPLEHPGELQASA